MMLAIAAVLEGSIFGDHCSPISDTTVLSSLSSQCDLLAHVKTQLPYALLAFAVTIGCGYLPIVLFGLHAWWIGVPLGLLIMAVWLLLVGRNPGVDERDINDSPQLQQAP